MSGILGLSMAEKGKPSHRNPLQASKSDGEGGLEMFLNRLQKNKKELGRWARKNGIFAYRVYDRDVPQVPVAVDRYTSEEGLDYLVLNYFRGPYDQSEDASDRVMDARIGKIVDRIAGCYGIAPSEVYVKLREKKKGNSQYEKLSQNQDCVVVREGAARFLVNLSDYLDTGLFLDHRPLRLRIGEESRGKHILNLFCYTGSFSIHAGLGGAASTTSVDLSPTYIQWAGENARINGLDSKNHEWITADVLEWVFQEGYWKRKKFDTILLDPPTFSNSKKMDQIWDLQAGYQDLITKLTKDYLAPQGVLYFSTNFRKFRMEEEGLGEGIACQDISESTIPRDFRDPKIHRCWRIVR